LSDQILRLIESPGKSPVESSLGPEWRRVFTDGSCLRNPDGPGGWAWAVPGGDYASGFDASTTNQRMEMTAVLRALTSLDNDPLVIISDSQYVVQCFHKEWHIKWRRNGWRNSKREPVANQDLWEPLVEEVERRGEHLMFRWVKGHSGDPMNDYVDMLAGEAAYDQVARSSHSAG